MYKLLIASAVLLLAACTEKTPNYAHYWQAWGDNQIEHWAQTTAALDTGIRSYCDSDGGNTGLAQMQSRVRDLALSWARINGLPYHGIADLDLSFELYFWPDKRDMTRARLSRRLAADEPLTAAALAEATAAEKGLLALEWAAFSEDLSRAQRCALLPAISTHYRNNVQRIQTYHQDHPLVLETWTQNQESPEGQSIALNLLFQQLAHLSNRLRNSTNAEGELIPVLAEGWRAGISTDIYSASLSATIEHLQALAARATLNSDNRQRLGNRIAELERVRAEVQNGTPDWPAVQQAIVDAEHLIEGPIAQEMNILLGFSNYDGD